MRYKILSSYFLITWLAVSLAAGLVWWESFRGYAAETTVLALAKSEKVTAARNLAELAKNLSFYEAVLRSEELLDDPFIGLTPDARKSGWHDLVSIRPAKGSDVLRIRSFSGNREQAELLAKATTRTLFETAARFYNVKTELDLRIVDGPLVTARVRSWPTFAAAAISTGFLVTLAFFFLLSLIDRMAGASRRKDLVRPQSAAFSPDTFKPMPPQGLDTESWFEKHHVIETPETAATTPVTRPRSKAAAPANLPIMEVESLTPLQGAMARLMKEDIDATAREQAMEAPAIEEPAVPRTEEPTPEEFKRRLNALLSGKIE